MFEVFPQTDPPPAELHGHRTSCTERFKTNARTVTPLLIGHQLTVFKPSYLFRSRDQLCTSSCRYSLLNKKSPSFPAGSFPADMFPSELRFSAESCQTVSIYSWVSRPANQCEHEVPGSVHVTECRSLEPRVQGTGVFACFACHFPTFYFIPLQLLSLHLTNITSPHFT